MRSRFVSLTFLVSYAPFFSRSDDGKLMFPAEAIAQAADVIVTLFAVMIFHMVDVISGAKNDVVVDVSFVNVGSDNIRDFPFKSLPASIFIGR